MTLSCRFEKRIYIPLPEASARVKMFELHMGNLKHSIEPGQLRELAEKTDGWGNCFLLLDICLLNEKLLTSAIRGLRFEWGIQEVQPWTASSSGETIPFVEHGSNENLTINIKQFCFNSPFTCFC